VNDVQAATLAVADDVDALRAERALFDTFVAADMDKTGLELHAKRSRFCSYLGDHLAVCRVLGNMKMFVDTRDHVLAPHLMTDGYWESWITLAMLRALKPGMVAVDVGANYGYYTILMGRCVGRTGKVISFEPNPHLASLMRKSLWISGIRLIDEVREEAAYSTTGEKVRFFIPEGRPMNARVVEETPYAGTLIDVPTVRLDDVLPEKVDFIKIDAEGGRAGDLAGHVEDHREQPATADLPGVQPPTDVELRPARVPQDHLRRRVRVGLGELRRVLPVGGCGQARGKRH
jgi:FkbM family methyltransferase